MWSPMSHRMFVPTNSCNQQKHSKHNLTRIPYLNGPIWTLQNWIQPSRGICCSPEAKNSSQQGVLSTPSYWLKILGVWLEEDAGSWSKKTNELCRSAYGRTSILTKLKYVGVSRSDLIKIYCLLIRSRAEYASVLFRSSLTKEQSKKIENISEIKS